MGVNAFYIEHHIQGKPFVACRHFSISYLLIDEHRGSFLCDKLVRLLMEYHVKLQSLERYHASLMCSVKNHCSKMLTCFSPCDLNIIPLEFNRSQF